MGASARAGRGHAEPGRRRWWALVDTLSLALCGELKAPLDPGGSGSPWRAQDLRLAEAARAAVRFHPLAMPFRSEVVTVEGEARHCRQQGVLR